MFVWLKNTVDRLLYTVFELSKESSLITALDFFLYDVIKILILLLIITHIMSLLNYYFPFEKIRSLLGKNNFFGLEYFFASLFGAITPFCSCSSIPLFIGFIRAGIPLGLTFAFLITSPLVNEVAIALFIGMFGWKVALVYLISGIFLGMVGGFILGKLKLEKYVESFLWKGTSPETENTENQTTLAFREKLKNISKDAFGIVKKIAPYVVIGIAVGAAIHGYVPEGFFENYIKEDNIFAVPLSVILAIPIYSNAAGAIPIVESLISKGIPLGTGLAFMMAVVGLSLPEFLILKKVMKIRLLLIFFGTVGFFIILLGYGFNVIF